MYITSSDDHDVHDVLMITYISARFPLTWYIRLMPVGSL